MVPEACDAVEVSERQVASRAAAVAGSGFILTRLGLFFSSHTLWFILFVSHVSVHSSHLTRFDLSSHLTCLGVCSGNQTRILREFLVPEASDALELPECQIASRAATVAGEGLYSPGPHTFWCILRNQTRILREFLVPEASNVLEVSEC